MLSYPENLPLPLQANYSESVSPNVKRSSMSDGYIRQRKVTSNAPRSLSVTWYFNSEQLVQFEDFLIQLNEGADWFLLKVPTKTYSEGVVSFATTERTVRFQSGKYTKTLQFFSDDKWLWKIAANLDLSMDDYAVDDIMPPEETQWNTNSDYDFEFLFSGGVPTVKGRKKCFIVSAENPTGTEDSNIIINSDSDRTGLNFYTFAVFNQIHCYGILFAQKFSRVFSGCHLCRTLHQFRTHFTNNTKFPGFYKTAFVIHFN